MIIDSAFPDFTMKTLYPLREGIRAEVGTKILFSRFLI